MPYVGGSLVPLFDHKARDVLKQGIYDMAFDGSDRLEDLIVMNTPIHHGNLRTSWYRLPVQRKEDVFETGVATRVSYAPYVEFGTGKWGPKHAPYEILPKKPGGFLAWREGGVWHYATKVMHPGSPGQHMVAIGCAALELEIKSGFFEHNVRRIAEAIEAQAEARQA